MQFAAGEKLRASDLNYLAETGTDARYSATAVQAFATNSDIRVAFGVADRETALLTRNAASPGHQFVLNRSGIWSIHATIRLQPVAGGGERYSMIRTSAGEVLGATGNPIPTSAGYATTMHPATTQYLAAGTIIEATVYQSSGGSINGDPSNPGWMRINFAWLKD